MARIAQTMALVALALTLGTPSANAGPLSYRFGSAASGVTVAQSERGAEAAQAGPLSYRLEWAASDAPERPTDVQSERAIGLPAHGPGSLLRDADDRYVVEVRTDGPPKRQMTALRLAGARVLNSSAELRTLTVAVSADDLEAVAATPGVDAVTEVLTPQTGRTSGAGAVDAGALNTCVPGVVSEGDTQLRAALARTDLEVDGSGLKVGVLSDSYDTRVSAATHAAGDVASGDLPGAGNPCGRTTPVQVLEDYSAGSPGDEGRAMLQIVHDVAPGAGLSFATAFNGEIGFANNIRALAAAGADVIVDDVIYASEPMFQDGPVAAAVSEVVDDGVTYVSMAFNNNQIDASKRDIASWEAPAFRSAVCPAAVQAAAGFVPGSDCMDFDPSGLVDTQFTVTAPVGGPLAVNLQWAQPRGGVTADYDLFALNGGAISAPFTSVNANGTTQQAYEYAGTSALGGTPGTDTSRNLVIARRPGSPAPRLKFIFNNNGSPITSVEYPTSTGGDVVGPSIMGHNGTAKAITVGAIAYNSTTAPRSYSSRGPVTHYFGPVTGAAPAPALATPLVLNKPDVTATDGGRNTFFGANTGGVYRFSGTSAAAPHAAAVAALQLAANPGLTPAQVRAAQQSTSTPIGAFGPLAVGSGLLDARAAVAATSLPPVAGASPALTNAAAPSFTFTANRPVTFGCSIDGAAPSACTSPYTPALAAGDHTITVVATDRAARNSAPVTLKVDRTRPTVKLTKKPKRSTTARKAKFKLKASEAGVTLQCKVDKGKYKECSAKLSFKVKPGRHTLRVKSTDAAGNQGKVVTYRWKVLR